MTMLLGIDLGTSSVKAMALAEDGSVRETASATYEVQSPIGGWAETDPADWWLATRKAVLSLAVEHRRQIRAIGLSGQMHGVVLTRQNGDPLRSAILWADTRSEEDLAWYRRLSPGVRRLLGNPLAAGMAGPTLLWLKGHESETYDAARWALQPKDWLRMRFTREVFSEATDASATLLYDLARDTWAQSVLYELGIRADLLPKLIGSEELSGRLTNDAAEELGLKAELPVAAGAGDAAASLLGHGLLDPGLVLLTIGTGGDFMSIRTELRPDPSQRTHLYRAIEKGKWYSMSAMLNAGLALDWARRLFEKDWAALYQSALDVPPGAEGATFLPYLVGERTPHFNAKARACWTGISLHHGREHLFRAVLEGVAFALREGMEALEAAGIPASELHLAGGGSVDPRWRQLLADVLNKPLMSAETSAGAARGAALLGGITAGVYRSPDETRALKPQASLVAEPGPGSGQYSHLYQRYKSVYTATTRVG